MYKHIYTYTNVYTYIHTRAYQQSDAAKHLLQDVKGPENKPHNDKEERGNIYRIKTTNISQYDDTYIAS